MEEVVTIGLDIAKSVFQVHGVNSAGENGGAKLGHGSGGELLLRAA